MVQAHDNNMIKHLIIIITASGVQAHFKSTSKLCKSAKEVVACLSPGECEEPPDLQHKQSPEKQFRKKARRKWSNKTLLDQQITTARHGMKPMPT